MSGALTVAHFGEAQKGDYHIPYLCQNLTQLEGLLGHPPPSSRGLFFAVQSLLYERQVLFFRVSEEGFSMRDYLAGFQTLADIGAKEPIAAVCVPGVGSHEIYSALIELCETLKSIVIATEADLYDYLTAWH